MAKYISKKVWMITLACAGLLTAQTFAQKENHKDEKPQNLKVLPKDISEDALHDEMKMYSKSLGVRCNFCHESHEVPGKERPEMNFASDVKKEKEVARDMIKMTADINTKYIATMGNGHKLDQITCVTCHNGGKHPITDVNQLPGKQ